MRVCRSTANAECIALIGAVDMTVYLQVVIGELLTGIYDIQFLLPGDIIPLLNHFRRPPDLSELRAESDNLSYPMRSSAINSDTHCIQLTHGQSLLWRSPEDSCVDYRCLNCASISRLSLPMLVESYNCLMAHAVNVVPPISSSRSRPFICDLALSDCANFISCLGR